MKKCLFLGYDAEKTTLIQFLKKKNWLVSSETTSLNYDLAKKFDLIISFGHKEIIKGELLEKIKKLKIPILNLHISYLPYNRGAHPNFWAHVTNTPSGVSIHEIAKKVGTGPI